MKLLDGRAVQKRGIARNEIGVRMAVDLLQRQTVEKLANRIVFRKSASSEDYSGMGTTVVAMLISPDRGEMTYANVGDSRIYRIHAGAMRQLTRDDSWVNLVPGSDTAAMKNVLTKALGAREEVDFDVVTAALTPGDVLLLCSDGLTNMLSDEDILAIPALYRATLARSPSPGELAHART